MIDYCGLHVHSHYSIRDGFCSVENIVKHCEENDYSACCITDHGSLGGALSLHSMCNERGIKPIVGCEFYVIDDRENGLKDSKKQHIILLAKNLNGFRNLIKINNDAMKNGFYKKPTTDYKYISEHSSGLICLTACAGGKASQFAIKNEMNELCCFLQEMKQVFNDDFYVELMLIDFTYKDKDGGFFVSQQEINKRLVWASQKTNVKTVITNDSHYINKSDSSIHEVVMLLSSGKTMSDLRAGKAWSFDVKDLYYKGIDDIYCDYDKKFVDSFSEDVLEDSLDNIEEIINKVEHYEIDSSFKSPKYCNDSENTLNVVTEICVKKLVELGKINDDVYVDRLEAELELLYDKGFLDYFLIVKEIIDYVRGVDGLGVGPGRGSCSGSLVAYMLGIVNIDCIKWGLQFERFLNPERGDYPDIDTDIAPNLRDLAKDYIFDKYVGKSCSIGTYGRLRFKSTLLDICRIFDIPPSHVFSVTKKLPADIDTFTLESARREFDFLDDFLNKYKSHDIPKYFNSLYGTIRNVSKHAAGVVICNTPIHDQIPLLKSGEHLVSAWSDGNDKQLSNLGFIKMDVLGLTHIKILSDTVKLIKQVHDVNININDIDLTDKKTFREINKLKLCGIFQFDTPISIQQVKNLKPKSIMELSNITAMIRPGPLRMGMDKVYKKNKENGFRALCPEIEEILSPTYGVMLYQEQIMEIVQAIGGFTLGGADTVRRLLMKSSKTGEDVELNSEFKNCKKRFCSNASNFLSEKQIGELWGQMVSFAGYGFNKAHSIPYTIIGYWESWLKTYYPVEFYCSLLKNVDTFKEGKKDGTSKINKIVREMKQCGIKMFPPDVNISEENFSVYNGGVMFGLSNIKGITKASLDLIKNRPYNTFDEIQGKNVKRIVNKRVVDALCGSGALLGIEDFERGGELDEVKFLGLKLSNDVKNTTKNTSLLKFNGRSGKYSGFLLSVKEFKTKKNNIMAKLSFEEIDSEVLIWPSDYIGYSSVLGSKVGKYIDFDISVVNGDTLTISKI